ncbi:hypothetical protein PoB_007033000 [Plakobranchus ocellatus]|uniref:Arrestin-like N-terminal domain-containing protein n=1 Tax=Plakobranchus ocellatus TaxID=259542 RepID=A0AAV4DI62_9GAST|nr:hypothetical protein PoB_007033000 [Plakobranchus ocellatus]
MKVLNRSSSFLCTDEYLVVGEDFVTFEVELSGNNSDYTYTIFDGPRFRIERFVKKDWEMSNYYYSICQPFLAPVDGFCLKRDITYTTGCSCELVGPQVYRVKAVYRIKNVNETRFSLLWPSLSGAINVSYYLPEIQGECCFKPLNFESGFIGTILLPYPGRFKGTIFSYLLELDPDGLIEIMSSI